MPDGSFIWHYVLPAHHRYAFVICSSCLELAFVIAVLRGRGGLKSQVQTRHAERGSLPQVLIEQGDHKFFGSSTPVKKLSCL